MRIFPLLLCAVLFAAGCSPKVTRTGGTTDSGGRTSAKVAKILRAVDDRRIDTRYLDAKAKVDLDSKDLSVGGTATIRIERDKAIWMSVKKFGFEGARALITQDSFFLINRLKGEYEAGPLSELEEKFKIPARFDLLQDILLGNPVFFTRDLEVTTAGEELMLEGSTREFATQYRFGAGDYALREMQLDDLGQGRQLRVSSSDYRTFGGLNQPFAEKRRIEIDGGSEGTATLEMNFTKIEVDGPFSMPFSKR